MSAALATQNRAKFSWNLFFFLYIYYIFFRKESKTYNHQVLLNKKKNRKIIMKIKNAANNVENNKNWKVMKYLKI